MPCFRSLTIVTVCCSFFLQLIMQPLVWATAPAFSAFAHTNPNVPLNASVDPIEQGLLHGYIKSVLDTSLVHPSLREAHERLSQELRNGRALLDTLSSPSLAQNENRSRLEQILATLLDQSGPLEERIAIRAQQEEAALDPHRDSATRPLPADLLPLCRQLFTTYEWAQDLYTAKAKLLGQYLLAWQALRSELVPGEHDQLTQRVASHLLAIGDAAGSVEMQQTLLTTIDQGYDQVKTSYLQASQASLDNQRKRTASLSQTLDTVADELRTRADTNSLRHSHLLELTKQALSERLVLIEQQQSTAAKSSAQGNLLHVPDTLPSGGPLGELATTYRQISRDLIASSLERKRALPHLIETLKALTTTMGKQDQAIALLIDQSPAQQQISLLSTMRDQQEQDRAHIDTQLSKLDQLLAASASLDGQHEMDVVANRDLAWQTVQLNTSLEEVLDELADLELNQQQANVLGALAIDDQPTTQELIQLNTSTTDLVTTARQQLKQLEESLEQDHQAFLRLETLAEGVIETADHVYGRVLAELHSTLQHTGVSDALLSQSLQGTIELLQVRKEQTALILRAKDMQQQQQLEQTGTCSSCDNGLFTWQQTTTIGAAIVDVLQQLVDVQQIAPLFADVEQSSYTDAQRIFALGSLLHVSVRLQLHDRSLDAAYDIGGRVLFVHHIGDPEQLLLSKSSLPGTQPIPYIGGNLFTDAWNVVGDGVQSVVKDAQAVVGKEIATVIQGAQVVGDTIHTVTSVAKDTSLATWDIIAETGKEVGSYLIDITGYLLVDDPSQGWSWSNVSLWKVGGLVLSGVGCVLGAVETAGVACIPFIATVANAALKPGVDRLPIEEQYKDGIKLGLDIAALVASLASGPLAMAPDKWDELSALGKVLTCLGLNPRSGLTAVNELFSSGGLLNINTLKQLTSLTALKTLLLNRKMIENLYDSVNFLFNWSKKINNLHDGRGIYGIWGTLMDLFTQNATPPPTLDQDSPTWPKPTGPGESPQDRDDNPLFRTPIPAIERVDRTPVPAPSARPELTPIDPAARPETQSRPTSTWEVQPRPSRQTIESNPIPAIQRP